MYAFLLLPRKQAAEYRRTIGVEVDEAKLHDILWNTMDPASRLQASQLDVHAKTYKTLADHIASRYKLTYGHVDLDTAAGGSNDPMGVFSIDDALEPTSSMPAPQGHLPSVSKHQRRRVVLVGRMDQIDGSSMRRCR